MNNMATPRECEGCYYFGKESDAPEEVEEECMYVPNEDNDYDYILPCMRKHDKEDRTNGQINEH